MSLFSELSLALRLQGLPRTGCQSALQGGGRQSPHWALFFSWRRRMMVAAVFTLLDVSKGKLKDANKEFNFKKEPKRKHTLLN
jgi:hypothetical protein